MEIPPAVHLQRLHLSQKEQITSLFGESDPVMIMVPNDSVSNEEALCRDLEQLDYVRSVQSISTLAGSAIPRDIFTRITDKSVPIRELQSYRRVS